MSSAPRPTPSSCWPRPARRSRTTPRSSAPRSPPCGADTRRPSGTPSPVEALLEANPGLERDAITRQLDAVGPAFTGDAARFGELRLGVLRAWARWEARFGITRRPPDVAAAFPSATAG